MNDERRYVSIIEAAKILGWSESTVRRMVAAGMIPHVRTSPRGSIRIELDDDGRPIVRQP